METENKANLTRDDRDTKRRTTSNSMPSHSSNAIKTIQFALPILTASESHEVHNYVNEHQFNLLTKQWQCKNVDYQLRLLMSAHSNGLVLDYPLCIMPFGYVIAMSALQMSRALRSHCSMQFRLGRLNALTSGNIASGFLIVNQLFVPFILVIYVSSVNFARFVSPLFLCSMLANHLMHI